MNKAQKTKDHILNEAFKLFLQKSYKEVTMEELQASTGLSRGGLYHHFNKRGEKYKGKEAIFQATVQRFFFSMAEEPLNIEEMQERGFLENFQAYLNYKQTSMDKILKSTGLEELDTNYFMLILQAIKYFPEMRDKVREQVVQETKNWVKIIELSQEKGEIRKDLDPATLAQHIYYLLDGLEMHLVMMGNINDEMYKEITTMISQLYDLIKR
ncbi:MAG TPA: hypothetical protein DCS93_38300 [Microscillaceae bacterium]|nr:hypothetical protein [Microscillaceae bacterium]